MKLLFYVCLLCAVITPVDIVCQWRIRFPRIKFLLVANSSLKQQQQSTPQRQHLSVVAQKRTSTPILKTFIAKTSSAFFAKRQEFLPILLSDVWFTLKRCLLHWKFFRLCSQDTSYPTLSSLMHQQCLARFSTPPRPWWFEFQRMIRVCFRCFPSSITRISAKQFAKQSRCNNGQPTVHQVSWYSCCNFGRTVFKHSVELT